MTEDEIRARHKADAMGAASVQAYVDLAWLLAELRVLRERKLALVEALEPFAAFARAFDAKPIRNIANQVYAIHPGTPWESQLCLSDCRRAARLLAKPERAL